MIHEPHYKNTSSVLTGEVKASKEVKIKAVAIGFCIALAAFDPILKVSTRAHIMFPGATPKPNQSAITRHTFDAIEDLRTKINKLLTRFQNITLALLGGSHVLIQKDDSIRQAYIHSFLKSRQEKNIHKVAQSGGGTERRSILVDAKTGCVYHFIGQANNKLLCCFISND
jgi:chemotaxis receptor (MCP) glutamine deamidase CheD